jgi:hypothetical protein
MAVEYEGTRQKLLENLEKMTTGTELGPVFTLLADEHNRVLAELVEIFYDYENTPGLPQTFNGSKIYEKFVDAMKRLSVMMKGENLEKLLKTLKSIKLIFAFASHLEQDTARLYGEMANSTGENAILDKLERMAAICNEKAISFETRSKDAPTDNVKIEITPLGKEKEEDTSFDDIII